MATRADRQVDQDLASKLRLERVFRPEIKSIFSRMVKSFAAVVARTGETPDADLFKGAWEGALLKHYDRVQRRFAGTVRSFQEKSLPAFVTKQDEDEDSATFLFALQKWSEEHSSQSSELITETSQKNYAESIIKARQELSESGEEFGDRDLALVAAALLRRKFNGRVSGIETLETQSAAEATKLIEAEVTAGIEPSIIAPAIFPIVTATKTWRTVGDKRVRRSPFNHVAANFQTVKITEPFIVSGERLRHPGDSSLGASVGNLAECRCSSIFSL